MSGEHRSRDADARRHAQSQFERPLVLEAGAGTGKTATLVARVVCWCLGPGWEKGAAELGDGVPETIARRVLEGVVAITFTDPAAAEMANRVGEAFASLESGGELPVGVDGDLLQPADAEARATRARALLASFDRLTVRTIHAFCLRLLSEHPLEAALPPHFEVDADSSAISELALEAVEEALRDSEELRRLLIELALLDVQPEAVVSAVIRLAKEGVPVEDIARDRFPDEELLLAQPEILGGLRDFLGIERERMRACPSNYRPTFAALDAAEALVPTLESGPLEREALFAVVEEHALESIPRLEAWAAGQFNSQERKKLEEDVDAAQEALSRAVPQLAAIARSRLPVLDRARRLLPPLVERTRRRLHDSGLATYSDLLRLARNLLRDEPLVRARERGRIRQLLVDEFQDTDRVQCELVGLLGLPEGGEAGPGLFLVGDPKQSIYGWRSADLAAYDEFKERVQAAGGEVHPLHVNFRSVPAILDEVERLVRPVMQEEARVQPRFEPLLACDRLAGESGVTELGRAPVEYWDCCEWPVDGGEDARPRQDKKTPPARAAEIEAEAIARDIVEQQQLGEASWKDFAILLRSSTHQEAFLRALRERGIPFEVGKDKSYYRRREVVDAGALVRTVLDPHDHLALLTWLRSPSVGVPDAALLPLWSRRFPEHCTRLAAPGDEAAVALRAAVDAAAREIDTSVPGLDAVAGWEHSLAFALEALASLRSRFEATEPDRFVELLRSASGIEAIEAARWLGAYRAANLERFFRELEEELLDAGTTRHDILRRLRRAVAEQQDAEEGRPRLERPDAVQVMSIHASKGLDFAQVYLPRLDNKGRGERSEDVDAALVEDSWELRLFNGETPRWQEAAAAARAVSKAERVRLLYVAATRAEKRLVLSSKPTGSKDPKEASLTSQLVAWREGGLTDWQARAPEAVFDGFGRTTWTDREALWSVCALAEPEGRRRVAGEDEGLAPIDPAAAAAESERLHARRVAAETRSARPQAAAASGLHDDAPSAQHHEDRAERLLGGTEELPAADRQGEGSSERRETAAVAPRGAALAAGTAVHRVLELAELTGDASELADVAESAVAHARSLAPRRERDAAEETTRELLARVAQGACGRRLFELGEKRVLARELPVALAPRDESGPVGCFVGSIDLVYRDPESGQPVVADHKSDRVESEEEIEEAVERHGPQLEVYRRAVQVALRLDEPPRAELWLLWPGRIVEVPLPEGER